jgi:hypothetical protein
MLHDFRRSRRVPRGIDAIRYVGFGTHVDVVVNGDVTAE